MNPLLSYINKDIYNKDINDIKDIDNTLLVLLRTSPTREELLSAYEKFEERFGVDCAKVKNRIRRHGKYMTDGDYFFKYNSDIMCMQQFRSKEEDVLKIGQFYKTFDMSRSWFWTITRKTFSLDEMQIHVETKERKNKHGDVREYQKLCIKFPMLDLADRNLEALFVRLQRYGYVISKKILVPEIKEHDFKVNYHYHVLLETSVNITKIRKNKRSEYRDLVYDPETGEDRLDGWINNAILSTIWKEITKDGSYRIKPEEIKKKPDLKGYGGAFNYLMSYLNKGVQYQNTDMIPYLEYAMKSRKPYRISGLNPKGTPKDERRHLPKIKYCLEDSDGLPVVMKYNKVMFVEFDELPDIFQIYHIIVLVDGVPWKKKTVLERLVTGKKIVMESILNPDVLH